MISNKRLRRSCSAKGEADFFPGKEDSERGKWIKRIAKSRSLTRTKENSQKRKVHFIFQAPDAKGVYLAGEFNEWHTQMLPMIKDENGAWNAAKELNVGRYEYKLFVDGAWMEA
jgi:1,4-alpha-glucan branching enzyme